MDLLMTTAADALAKGDPIRALNCVALRDDAHALAFRGTAMAQLGDLDRARTLMRRAARAFGPKDTVARARCIVAECEIALAARNLAWPTKALIAACETLEASGDLRNAAHARMLDARRLLLSGQFDEAEYMLEPLDVLSLSPALRAIYELALAWIAIRRIRATAARASLARAEEAARWSRIPALIAEVEYAVAVVDMPVARLIANGEMCPLLLEDVEALLVSNALVIDACRHFVRVGPAIVPLASRPVLFALARELGEAWPRDVPRDRLLACVFGAKHADESHRLRLRVEIGRLRALLRPHARINATKRGFALAPNRAPQVVVLAAPVDEAHADVLALLADGEMWSSSALAMALGTSQRTVQRALDALTALGKAEAIGQGRAQRWITPPLPGFATVLLLPAPLPAS